MLAWLGVACGPATPAACAAGYDDGGDGTCVIPWEGEATLEDLLEGLAPCVPEDPSDRLDVRNGCADGVCVGMTAAEVTTTLGETPTCLAEYHEHLQAQYVACSWASGFSARFQDYDLDELPDEGDPLYGLAVVDPWDGTSAEGLGRGVGFGCFVDVLGEPSDFSLTHDGAEWRLDTLVWARRGLSAGWDSSEGPWNGWVDDLYLFEPY